MVDHVERSCEIQHYQEYHSVIIELTQKVTTNFKQRRFSAVAKVQTVWSHLARDDQKVFRLQCHNTFDDFSNVQNIGNSPIVNMFRSRVGFFRMGVTIALSGKSGKLPDIFTIMLQFR